MKPKVKLGWYYDGDYTLCYFSDPLKRWIHIGSVERNFFDGYHVDTYGKDGNGIEVSPIEISVKKAKQKLIDACGFSPDGEIKRIR